MTFKSHVFKSERHRDCIFIQFTKASNRNLNPNKVKERQKNKLHSNQI